MNKAILVFLGILLIACAKREEGVSQELYEIVAMYQESNHIPKGYDSASGYRYIYEVMFDKENSDTVVSIGLNPLGIHAKVTNYGPYSDEQLHPFVIVDEQLLGKRFVNEYRREDLSRFVVRGYLSDELHPIYYYKVVNNKFILFDTFKGNQGLK